MKYFLHQISRGRPDNAYFKFTHLLYAEEELPLYNASKHRRDMTYIDDIIAGVVAAVEHQPDEHRIYNLGSHSPVELMDMVQKLESLTKCTARIKVLPLQDGDVLETYVEINAVASDLGFFPKTRLKEGLAQFVT